MTIIYRCDGSAITIQQVATGETIPDGWSVYDGVIEYDAEGNLFMTCDNGVLRQYTTAERKALAADVKREEIYLEQEIRTRSFWQWDGCDRHYYAFIQEQYFDVLKPAARNAIDEQTTPIHWGLKTLSENTEAALNALQAWVDDPDKTAGDILAFDVAGWAGWDVERPE